MDVITVLLKRGIFLFLAWCVGWGVYMIAMMMTTYDGFPSLILQPIMAALFSALFVAVAVLVGLFLRIPPLWRIWTKRRLWAGLLILVSLFLLCFGSTLGWTVVQTNPDTKAQIVTLDPAIAIGAYFGLLFAIANWPIRKPELASPWVKAI